jgi:hypothetical protein
MDDSELQVECPHCGAVFGVADGPAGRQATCPVCRGAVKVLDVAREATTTAEGEQEQEHPPSSASGGLRRTGEHEQEKVQDYFAARSAENLVSADAGYCLVCCAHEEKPNLLAVSPVLRSFTGVPARDAAHQVTHGMGILAERLAPDTALSLVVALKAKGTEAFAVPAEKAPGPVDHVQIASIYDVDQKALHVQVDAQGTVRALGWDAVLAGVTTKDRLEEHRTVEYDTEYSYGGGGMAGAGIVSRRYSQHERVEAAPLTLSLVVRDQNGRLHVMTVKPLQVRYAYLGERLLNSHSANFLLFLADVAKWAQGAYFPPSYVHVAAGSPFAVKEPAGRAEYNNYLRWAVCCAVARGGQPGHRED